MVNESDEPELLDASADATPELGDHPDEVTAEEAEAGEILYHEIDDLDDDSTGLPEPTGGLESTGRERAIQRAQILRGVLLKHGVPEVSIELQEGRPSGGDDWNACRPVAVFSHHIASRPTKDRPIPGLSLVKNGRSDLPGPLCNGTAGVDLVYRIMCMGLANHPGSGWTPDRARADGIVHHPERRRSPLRLGDRVRGRVRRRGLGPGATRIAGPGCGCPSGSSWRGRTPALVEGIWLINGRGQRAGARQDLSGYHGEHKTWAPGRQDRIGTTTPPIAAARRSGASLVPTPFPG